MKTIIIAVTGLMLSLTQTANARNANTIVNNYQLTTKTVASGFTSLVVAGNVDIILVQGNTPQFSLEGYQNQLENITMKVVNNTLFVSTKKHIRGKNPVVYIPVNNLQYLTVEGNSNIATLGYLTSNVDIELSSECKVSIKTSGRITISDKSTRAYQVEKWVVAGKTEVEGV